MAEANPGPEVLKSACSSGQQTRAGDPDVFPLSFMQEGIWLAEQMTPGTSAYNLPGAWRLRGTLNLPALRAALDKIMERHETLRTVFGSHQGRPVQIILPQQRFPLRLIDLSKSTQNKQAAWHKALALQARRPFDLARGPLARASLFQLADNDHVLLLNLHHLIFDEWSVGILLREIAEYYAAFSQGKPPAISELPIQYVDFVLWQRDALAAKSLQPQLDYWKAQLAGSLPVLTLPNDHPRPKTSTFHGATEFFTIDQPLAEDLKALSRRQGVTLFMTLLAAFKTLLHRYTRQTDIIVGAPMAGREHVQTENLIGLFVNTHALRTDLSGDPRFCELLCRIREVVLGAFAHQETATDLIVETIRPERNPGCHPLFQVVFGLQPAKAADWALADLATDRMEVDNGGSKFDCTWLLSETNQGLRLQCEYNTDLFEPATMRRLVRHFLVLLESAAARPDQRLSELPMLTNSERRELLNRWSKPDLDPEPGQCLHRWFEEQVHRTPDAIAVAFEQQTLTYRQLNSQANQLAHRLQKLGVGPDRVVALCLERSPKLVVAILAVLKAGGAYLPIDPAYPKDRIKFMLEDSQAVILLAQARLNLPHRQVLCLDSDWDQIATEPIDNIAGPTAPESAAYIIYTSGSTGNPKGVLVSHQNVSRLFKQTEQWFGFNSSDVWTLFHSFTFDFSVWELWGALLYGGRLVIVPYLISRSPSEFLELLAREKVTVLNQTPSAFRQLIWAEAMACKHVELNLRYIICGGEALELQSLRPWFDRHGDDRPQIVNMYGITETTVHVTYCPIRKTDLADGLGSVIGVPIPDLRLYLLDDHLNPVPPGVPAEICVGGAGVARGYLNRPELTSERFVPDPFTDVPGRRLYRSGDLARATAKGELEYLGRKDKQVKIRGFRVELGEIESALNQHPALRESLVIACAGPGADQRLIAYVVPVNGPPDPNALRVFLEQRLPYYMIPAAFISLPGLPLTNNGKVDQRALPSPAAVSEQTPSDNMPPSTELEKTLVAIWCQVLDRKSIGIHDNFFHIGGHSLLATQVISRASAATELELSVRMLFENPTIASLAAALATVKGPDGSGSLARAPLKSAPSAQDLLARVDQLTSAEVDELLRQSETLST